MQEKIEKLENAGFVQLNSGEYIRFVHYLLGFEFFDLESALSELENKNSFDRDLDVSEKKWYQSMLNLYESELFCSCEENCGVSTECPFDSEVHGEISYCPCCDHCRDACAKNIQ